MLHKNQLNYSTLVHFSRSLGDAQVATLIFAEILKV